LLLLFSELPAITSHGQKTRQLDYICFEKNKRVELVLYHYRLLLLLLLTMGVILKVAVGQEPEKNYHFER